MAGLYIHIPFCVKKCHYCNFVITTAPNQSAFSDLLDKEAAHFRDAVRHLSFETLYLGGGTPSTLSENQMEELFLTLRKNFSLDSLAEATLEPTPPM